MIQWVLVFFTVCNAVLADDFTLAVPRRDSPGLSLFVPWRLTLRPELNPFDTTAPNQYRYWRPEFAIRTDTPEKIQALRRLFNEYGAIITLVKALNNAIESNTFKGDRLIQLFLDRDELISRYKALEFEVQFWRH
jgi:hypothetical protein